jgi:hypothetical protein
MILIINLMLRKTLNILILMIIERTTPNKTSIIITPLIILKVVARSFEF